MINLIFFSPAAKVVMENLLLRSVVHTSVLLIARLFCNFRTECKKVILLKKFMI